MVFDETADLHDTLVRIAEFFKHESCGQCVPCRIGTVRQLEWLSSADSRKPEAESLLRNELSQAMRDASICGLGQTASSAIDSAFANVPSLRRPS
jgi:NADH-quinone oxidoreductase subunit F